MFCLSVLFETAFLEKDGWSLRALIACTPTAPVPGKKTVNYLSHCTFKWCARKQQLTNPAWYAVKHQPSQADDYETKGLSPWIKSMVDVFSSPEEWCALFLKFLWPDPLCLKIHLKGQVVLPHYLLDLLHNPCPGPGISPPGIFVSVLGPFTINLL